MNDEDRLCQVRPYWDDEAATFDDEADHGLRDPMVRTAWANHLADWMPSPPAAVLDIGCGTGSLSILLSTLGHEVTAIDPDKGEGEGCRISYRSSRDGCFASCRGAASRRLAGPSHAGPPHA